MINSLVNNVTNLTLLLGLPALIWGLQVTSRKSKKRERQMQQINRLQVEAVTAQAKVFREHYAKGSPAGSSAGRANAKAYCTTCE